MVITDFKFTGNPIEEISLSEGNLEMRIYASDDFGSLTQPTLIHTGGIIGTTAVDVKDVLEGYIYNRRMLDLPGYRPGQSNSGILAMGSYVENYSIASFQAKYYIDDSLDSSGEVRMAMLGKQSPIDFKYNNKFSQFSTRRHLTDKPTAINISPDAIETLPFINANDAIRTVYLVKKSTNSSGITTTTSYSATLKNFQTCLFVFSLDDTDAVQITVGVYSASDGGSGSLLGTRLRTYTLSRYNLYASKTYFFRNLYGRVDSISFDGQQIFNVSSKSESFRKQEFNSSLLGQGIESVFRTNTDGFKQQSGYMNADMLAFAKQFTTSEEIWEVAIINSNRYLIPLVMEDTDIDYQIERAALQDKQFNFSCRYNFNGIK